MSKRIFRHIEVPLDLEFIQAVLTPSGHAAGGLSWDAGTSQGQQGSPR